MAGETDQGTLLRCVPDLITYQISQKSAHNFDVILFEFQVFKWLPFWNKMADEADKQTRLRSVSDLFAYQISFNSVDNYERFRMR